jgi:RimJ/RimL family protein N-acetyltransferase
MVQIRRATESDHGRILSFLSHDPLNWVDAETYRRYLESGSYGVDRIWLAEDDGHIKACAVWYGSPGRGHSLMLDCFWVDSGGADRAALSAAVLQAAHEAFEAAGHRDLPVYHLFLKPEWRSDPVVRHEVEWRQAAARSTGLSHHLERLRYEWTSDAALLPSPARLIFSNEPDDVFLNLFERVATATLDYGTRESVARLGLEGHARETLDCHRSMRGERAWWRIARTDSGEIAGFTIPSANEDWPVIGYLGVVPEMRGRGYAVDLLVEATHILAANGAERIRADTDTPNLPMAKSFERAGYRHFSVRLVMSAGR